MGKAFYKQKKSLGGINLHVIYNFGSHRVDADLSFGEDCEGLRDDYIENVIKESAEYAVEALNAYSELTALRSKLKSAVELIEYVASGNNPEGTLAKRWLEENTEGE
jgi:hypothetical protein